MPNFQSVNGRWVCPIGPAPEGWQVRENCSCTIPHTEASYGPDVWQDDDMNLDHYDNVVFVPTCEEYEYTRILGAFVNLHDAALAVKADYLDPEQHYDKYDYLIRGYSGHIKIAVPIIWRDGVNL